VQLGSAPSRGREPSHLCLSLPASLSIFCKMAHFSLHILDLAIVLCPVSACQCLIRLSESQFRIMKENQMVGLCLLLGQLAMGKQVGAAVPIATQ
jgi:hypothetical protein